MKNVTALPTQQEHTLELPLSGSYPLWALKYTSGVQGNDNLKAGDWLAKWEPHSDGKIIFGFSKKQEHFYLDKRAAENVSEMLREKMGIETEVVKVR